MCFNDVCLCTEVESHLPEDRDYRCVSEMVTSDGYCLVCGEMDDHLTVSETATGQWVFTDEAGVYSEPFATSKEAWAASNAYNDTRL